MDVHLCFLKLYLICFLMGGIFDCECVYSSPIEVEALAAFKREVFDDPKSVLSDWNMLDEDPCNWFGITCSMPQKRVISLKLTNLSLKGFITREIGLLSSLQELNLEGNLLIGVIPKEIGKLKNLTILDLSSNQLNGTLPHEIGNLTSLIKLYEILQSNGISGIIPNELWGLVNLAEIRLDRNKFTGGISESNYSRFYPAKPRMSGYLNNSSGLCEFRRLRVANFSYNFLDGKIPPCFKTLRRSIIQLQGNCLQDKDANLQRSAEQCVSAKTKHYDSSNDEHESSEPKWRLILEIVAGILVLIFLGICIFCLVNRCTPNSSLIFPRMRTLNLENHMSAIIEHGLDKDLLKVSRQELEIACEDFSNIIGSSSFITIYKGTLKDGLEVAVMSLCISKEQWTSNLDAYFQNEVADLARLNHGNISKLLGYCEEAEPFSRMLLFEYASNGTLHEHLHTGDTCQLSWLRRMRIALGVARGLRYLHTELQPPFTISEFNSTSVYLTEDFSPKLVDFERWKTLSSPSRNQDCFVKGGSGNGFAGPQEKKHMDVQANTLAFGILLLELISGRPTYSDDRGALVDWAKQYLQDPGNAGELLDPQVKDVKTDEILVICGVASLCMDPQPSKRPSMQIICAMLEDGIDTSASARLKEPSLAWAQLALSTQM